MPAAAPPVRVNDLDRTDRVPPAAEGALDAHPAQARVATRPVRGAVHEIGSTPVPSWARDRTIGNRLINARAETVAGKPAFRAAFRRRRCLVPANGWFEWQRSGGKVPYWISLSGGRPFSFAGLWEVWGEGESRMESFSILTCPAGAALEGVHVRQPAIVAPEVYADWLSPDTPAARLLGLVQAPHAGPFELRRVSPLANSPRNDAPEILRAVEG